MSDQYKNLFVNEYAISCTRRLNNIKINWCYYFYYLYKFNMTNSIKLEIHNLVSHYYITTYRGGFGKQSKQP